MSPRRPSWRRPATALLPAAGLAVIGGWAGTMAGGATAAGAAAVEALALAGAAAATSAWRDPLRLGRRGRLLVWALLLLAAASVWASPVPRAGRLALTLLPAFLLLPAAVARAWDGAAGRRWGPRGVAAVVLATAAWALAGRLAGDPRAAAPLGHHLLLAVWLLALLPVAALPLRAGRSGDRLLGAAAVAAGVTALVFGGSLAAAAGLGLEAVLVAAVAVRAAAAWPAARRRRLLVLLGLGLALVALGGLLRAAPRLWPTAGGADPSFAARGVYAAAAWRGAAARPALGWGPGSTAWTLAEHLRPVPGVDPPGEVVAEVHSLPLAIAYELGLPGALLAAALAALFFRRRRAAAVPAAAGGADPLLVSAGLAGLAGAGVALLATAWLAVAALPAALAVAAGAALAGEGGVRRRRGGWGGALYAAVAAISLLSPLRAQLHYDRAVAADEVVEQRRQIDAAVRLDPGFPLYRAWQAWAAAAAGGDPVAVAEAELAAAQQAPGVAALWLAAGVDGAAAGTPWAAEALGRACRLDPLGALAPFHLAVLEADRDPAAAAIAGGRALLAEPRLAAATYWEGREELLAAVLGQVSVWPGIDAGWRQALVAAVGGWDTAVPGSRVRLALRVDPGGGESLLLRSFRRRPRAFFLAPVELRRELAAQLTLPPASTLPQSAPGAFGERGCGG